MTTYGFFPIIGSVCDDLQSPTYWPGTDTAVLTFFYIRQMIFATHLAVNFVGCEFLAAEVRFRFFSAKP